MSVITVSGDLGSGARQCAENLAKELKHDFVHQALLVETAQRLGISVERAEGRDERPQSLGERVSGVLRTFLERSATMGATDPLLGASGLEVMLSRSYEEAAAEGEPEVSDRKYVETISSIIQSLADRGNVVIVGRGSNIVLRDHPTALHISVVAPREVRIPYWAVHEGISEEESQQLIEGHDAGRIAFYRKFFGCHPNDPHMYHITLNAGRLSQDAMLQTALSTIKDAAVAE